MLFDQQCGSIVCIQPFFHVGFAVLNAFFLFVFKNCFNKIHAYSQRAVQQIKRLYSVVRKEKQHTTQMRTAQIKLTMLSLTKQDARLTAAQLECERR